MAIAVPHKAQKADRPSVQGKGWPYDHPLLLMCILLSFLSAYAQAARPSRAAAFRLSGRKAVPAATATGYPLNVPAPTLFILCKNIGFVANSLLILQFLLTLYSLFIIAKGLFLSNYH
jgi:hypothetical protein